MPVNVSTHNKFPIPGGTVNDSRLTDIVAVKNTLTVIDDKLHTQQTIIENLNGSAVNELPLVSSTPAEVQFGTVKLYAIDQPVQAIPDMTGPNTPSGVASSSTNFNTTPAWNAFKAGAGWISSGAALPQWIQYQFPVSNVICQYAVDPWDANAFPIRCPVTWTLQGSNDELNWTALDTQTGVTDWQIGVTKTYPIITTIPYTYYRLNITQNNGDTYTAIRRLSLFVAVSSLWVVDSAGKRKKLSD